MLSNWVFCTTATILHNSTTHTTVHAVSPVKIESTCSRCKATQHATVRIQLQQPTQQLQADAATQHVTRPNSVTAGRSFAFCSGVPSKLHRMLQSTHTDNVLNWKCAHATSPLIQTKLVKVAPEPYKKIRKLSSTPKTCTHASVVQRQRQKHGCSSADPAHQPLTPTASSWHTTSAACVLLIGRSCPASQQGPGLPQLP